MTVEEATPDYPLDWNAVYADQLPRIYNYFRFRCSPDADIEELTARTFEKAWRARDRYQRDVAGFSTWLFRIARNVGIDYARTSRAHVTLEVVADVQTEFTPEDEAAQLSDRTRLSALTARLTEREQELIALKYGSGLSNRFIARVTGLSESNVGTLLHRAVATLRSQW